MFGKHLKELTKDDIQRLVTEKVPESAELEFKETLPTKDGGNDSWLDGSGKIGDKARNEILEEIIAFANAYGGTLVIGIKETKEKPSRAARVTPIVQCEELAERLRLQCRDCIEPQIQLLDTIGVPTKKNGSGVVVIRVPKSRGAPHRLTPTRECYFRHSDRSEKMTMREIQDLTLQIERGLGAINTKFLQRQDLFPTKLKEVAGNQKRAFGFRATLIPTTPIGVDRVHNVDAFKPPMIDLKGKLNNSEYKLHPPARSDQWRPILRGTRGVGGKPDFSLCQEVYCDGLIESTFCGVLDDRNRIRIYVSWFMGFVGNSLCGAEKFRRAAGAPDVEYGLELEIQILGPAIEVAGYGRDWFVNPLASFPSGTTLFPRYSIGSANEFVRTAELIERDFWHTTGHDWEEAIEVDFDDAFERMGLIRP